MLGGKIHNLDMATAVETIQSILPALDARAKLLLQGQYIYNKDVLTVLQEAVHTGTLAEDVLEPLFAIISAFSSQRVFVDSLTNVAIDGLIGHSVSQCNSALGQDPTNTTKELVESILISLQHIFVFCASASAVPPGSASTSASTVTSLQGMMAMLSLLGALTGVQVAVNVHAALDKRAMVYPCPHPHPCGKTFCTPTSLGAHIAAAATATADGSPPAGVLGEDPEKPFKCPHCPQAFARNHDLKRHSKGHGSVAFQCAGCDRSFTRRDALKRHQENARKPGQEGCRSAGVITIEIEAEDAAEDAATGGKKGKKRIFRPVERRAALEDGEVPARAVRKAIRAVLSLVPSVQARVAHLVAANPGASLPMPVALPPAADPGGSLPPATEGAAGQADEAQLALSSEQELSLQLMLATAQAQAEAEAMNEYGEEEEYYGEEWEEGEGEDDGGAEGMEVDATINGVQ